VVEGKTPEITVIRGKPPPTLAEFDARLRRFFVEVYYRRECAETRMATITAKIQ
jgi:hypothetical protein